MKRIDSVNARPDENGLGKAGFNDNADLPGQDATYVTPGWFNTVQEELCNLLELRGITLDPASKRQLYDLLTTQVDLEALADEIETNFIRKNQIIDNLTTHDATKVASARTVKELQDKKLEASDLKDASTTQKGVVQLNNTLTSTSTTEALTAAQGKVLNDQAYCVNQTWKDVKSNRILGATYQNPSSKPITLFIRMSGQDSGIKLTENDFIFPNLTDTYAGSTHGQFVTIGPFSSYKIEKGSAFANTLLDWFERS